MRTVYILGAGVDCPLGLPLADGLLRELDAFAKADGKSISRAIKNKLGGARRVRFSFEKYVSNQGEGFAERVLTDAGLMQVLDGALKKVGDNPSAGAVAVQTLLRKLHTIREANEIDESTAKAVATLAGESEEMADHTLLRMRGVGLNPSPRNAMLRIFRDAQAGSGLSDSEAEAFGLVVAAMTNFEELLTELFAGFYTGRSTDIRSYLYVAWLLWVYMRWKSIAAGAGVIGSHGFYDRLRVLPPDDRVITFNYTDLGELPLDRTIRFHGDCLSYIRYDRGELITGDQAVTTACDLGALEQFIEGLEMDIEAAKIFLPAIVPPSAMKPVINRAFIGRWSEAERLMAEADLLLAVGYSFNRVDSHFNDLFRSSAAGKRVAIINPDVENAKAAVCALLGVDPSVLSKMRMAGAHVERSTLHLFVPLRSEDISAELLTEISAGWS